MATRRINLLVIHCSATPNGRWTTASDIDRWHAERGFHRAPAAAAAFNPQLPAIGYHWVIYTNGARDTGRSPDEIGAHALGYNARSLGLCLIGTDRYTYAQWGALADQVEHLCRRFDIPLQLATPGNGYRGVCGHRDLSPDLNGNGEIEPREWIKTCPGFDVADWMDRGRPPLPDHVLEPA